jgi:HTH-type transcriptional regulator/antitoxin HipB
MSFMKDTPLRSAEQLGLAIRLKRKEKGLSQTALAELLGTERKWVLRLEAGNPRAELGLVLKALDVLRLQASFSDLDRRSQDAARKEIARSRLDEVFRRVQRSVGK